MAQDGIDLCIQKTVVVPRKRKLKATWTVEYRDLPLQQDFRLLEINLHDEIAAEFYRFPSGLDYRIWMLGATLREGSD